VSDDAVSGRVTLGPSLADVLFAWFQRVVAAYCLIFGALYWVRLLGFYPGPLWRFDTMPVHWQIASSLLAVLFPFAAAGLWMLASWGPVIWFLCAATETVMYAGLPRLFGERWQIVATHAAVALVYIVFRLLLHWQRRQAQHA
jgi:hypothetical protein